MTTRSVTSRRFCRSLTDYRPRRFHSDSRVVSPRRSSSSIQGSEVVQVYVSESHTSRPHRKKQLKAFKKVGLEPGREAHILIGLGNNTLSFYGDCHRVWTAETGTFTVLMGPCSRDIRFSRPGRDGQYRQVPSRMHDLCTLVIQCLYVLPLKNDERVEFRCPTIPFPCCPEQRFLLWRSY